MTNPLKNQTWKQFFLSSKGRVSRFQYNVYFLIPYVVLSLILYILPTYFNIYSNLYIVVSIASFVLSLIILWPFIALTNKRFHDRAVSGWRQLGYAVVSIVGMVACYYGVDFDYNYKTDVLTHTVVNPLMANGGAALAILPIIAMFIELCALKGTTGVNKFGMDPAMEAPINTDHSDDQEAAEQVTPSDIQTDTPKTKK